MVIAERAYEMVVVLNPNLGENEVSSAMERINRAITERGGSILDQNMWGRRRLAYQIKKFSEGTYMVSHVNLVPTRVGEIENSLTLNENVLRHLIVRMDE